MSTQNNSKARSTSGDSARATAGTRGTPLSRREALCRGLAGAAGLLLAGGARAVAQPPVAKAKSVIQIWLAGGLSQLDTFDPKPEAGYDYCGPLAKAIPTNVDGIRIGEMLPLLAKQADKYSIIRSMTHGGHDHPDSAYTMQTGRPHGERLVYPCAGAVVGLFKGYDAGYKGLIPPYVVVTQSQGRFSEAGFLGQRYKPFATGGDPAQPRFMVEGIVSQGISDQQQKDRRVLLDKLDMLSRTAPGSETLTAFQQAKAEAYDMILGDGAKAFDLAQEEAELRSRYGLHRFGQAALAARRLVERGVPYITINWSGWDTHTNHFTRMQQMLPELDQGLATLLADLSDRGLLQSTIIWCCGEMGHAPKIDWPPPFNGGRNHWTKVFSVLVAGGGFQGGRVVGASDAKAEEVKDRPVYPCDLIGSIYQLLGIDPDGKLPNPMGLALTVTPAAADGVPTGGRLKEIM